MVHLNLRRNTSTSHTRAEGAIALCDLRAGETAFVTGLDERLPEQIRHRLEDLGLDEGAEISMLRRAPMGDPCIYRIRDYDLCLRRREADRVRCDTLPGA